MVYVMSRDQRVRDNHALRDAQLAALDKRLPLIVLFVLRTIATRSREHYTFMLDGLEQVAGVLRDHNIPWIIRQGSGAQPILDFLQEAHADSVFFDYNPLAGPRQIVATTAQNFLGTTTVVDTHNSIPVWVASDHQEFAAHTLRRKVHKLLPTYLQDPPQIITHPHTTDQRFESLDFKAARSATLAVPSCGIHITATAGEDAAHQRLAQFMANTLPTYARQRNNITAEGQSELSPYLHFGHIASLRVALEVLHSTNTTPLLFDEPHMAQSSDEPSASDGTNALFEEMIVRKELADNFCHYQAQYQTLAGAPDWARTTLRNHMADTRSHVYTRHHWESATTHDPIWNAAQCQLLRTGKIHGYMRMYWAKKMLEWSDTPQKALTDCIYLNDKFSVDGGDPNGYVGILWSIAGLHDRPWAQRPVFGKIRYMNAAGLRRKFDVDAYVQRWA